MRRAVRSLIAGGWILVGGLVVFGQQKPIGYTDTPLLPGGKWRVHDGTRPQPVVVTPGAGAAVTSMTPPADATVLLGGGSDLGAWQTPEGAAASWPMKDGVLDVGKGTLRTRAEFTDFQLHIEFSTPGVVQGEGQDRGNSGVFLLGEFEVQVLDSYRNVTYPDGQAGALYGQYPPLVNVSRAPGEWQALDVVFTAPRFSAAGTLQTPAIATVFHNGVVIHHATPFVGPTAHRTIEPYTPALATGPIALQDHGNPVRYRNIWIRTLKGYDSQ